MGGFEQFARTRIELTDDADARPTAKAIALKPVVLSAAGRFAEIIAIGLGAVYAEHAVECFAAP